MIEVTINRIAYQGEDVDGIVRQILSENEKKNKVYKHKPYPTDYNSVYNNVVTKLKKMDDGYQIEKTRNLNSKIRRERQISQQQPVTFSDAVRGANAIIKMAKGQVVNSEEILRRSNICSGCPLSTRSSGCATCRFGRQVANVVNGIRGLAGRSITYPSIKGAKARDMNCGFCGCALIVMLPAKIECFNEPEEKNQARPDHCWAKNGGTNYIAAT